MCERAARLAARTLPPEPRQHAAWLIAVLRMAAGDARGARAILTEGRDPDMPVLPRFWADPGDPPELVRIALACGDDQLAAQAVAIAERRGERNPGVASLAAIAAHARGLRDGDVAEVGRAVRLFARSPRRLAMASAVEDLGRLLVRDGQTAEGISQLNEALELYARMGGAWDVTRVRGRLRQLGVRRNLAPARPAAGWAGLTDSELAVVRLVAAGQTNRQIAEQLFLSPNTISSHLRRVFAKLGISSRVELVRLFVARRRPGSRRSLRSLRPLGGQTSQLGPGTDPELRERMPQVGIDGVGGEEKLAGGLAVRQSPGHQVYDRLLGPGQAAPAALRAGHAGLLLADAQRAQGGPDACDIPVRADPDIEVIGRLELPGPLLAPAGRLT